MILLFWTLACAHPEPPVAGPELSHITVSAEALGEAAVPERERMLAALHAGDPSIVACYQRALSQNPGLYGDLVLWIELTADGKVRKLQPEFSTITDAALNQCVLDTVAALSFPTPSRDGLTLRYPYVFTAPGTPPEVTRALLLHHGLISDEASVLPTDDVEGEPDAPAPPGVVITW